MADDITLKVGFDIEKFLKGINSSLNGLDSLKNGVLGMAKTFGLVFGVKEIAAFGLEVSNLAGEAEGVRSAFNKLPSSITVMQDLKSATHDTVSELDLMKRTVQATNFGISLQALPKLLEFATLRAQQTGQSVDYLVDSIVTGIGRKSPLILDNLGISAVALKDKLGDVSIGAASVGDVANAVGKIAEESLKNMAGFSDNASTKIQKLGASWDNLKVAIGSAANETGVLGNAIDALSQTMNILASNNLDFFDKLGALFGGPGGLGTAIVKDYAGNLKAANDQQKLQESIIRQADQAIQTFGTDLQKIGEAYKQNINASAILEEVQKRMTDQHNKETEAIARQAEAWDKAREAHFQYVKDFQSTFFFKDTANGGFSNFANSKNKIGGASIGGLPDKVNSPFDVDKLIEQRDEYYKVLDESLTKYRTFKDLLYEYNEEIQSSFAQMSGGVIISVANAFGRGQNIGKAFLTALGQLMQKYGEQLVLLGAAKVAEGIAFKDGESIASGAGLIAAGGALVAGGAAIIANNASSGAASGAASGKTTYESRAPGSLRANSEGSKDRAEVVFVIKGQDLVGVVKKGQANNKITRIG